MLSWPCACFLGRAHAFKASKAPLRQRLSLFFVVGVVTVGPVGRKLCRFMFWLSLGGLQNSPHKLSYLARAPSWSLVPKAPALEASSFHATPPPQLGARPTTREKARLNTRTFVASWPSVNDVLHRLLKAVSSTASSTMSFYLPNAVSSASSMCIPPSPQPMRTLRLRRG